MRCLALEKALENGGQKFEYLGDGKYKFWSDCSGVKMEYCGPAEYKDEYESSLADNIFAYYVKYEKPQKGDKSLECGWLIWDFQYVISCDIPDFCTTLVYAMLSPSGVNEDAKKKYALLALEYIASAVLGGDKAAKDFMENVSPFADKYSDTPEAQFFKGIKLIMQTPPDKADPKVIAGAEKLIKAAADAGGIQAMMVQGIDIEQNPKVAVQYLRKAAAAGNLHAKWLLASDERFATIVGVSARINYLKELIAVGNKNARNLYAQLLDELGKTVEAIKEYRAAIASGHAGSMTMLHLLLLRQQDEKVMDEAWKLLTQAMEKHDGLAQCLAGMSCFDSPNYSPRFGMHLLMKGVVDRGGTLYFYLHHIAMNYAQGIGVAKSAENAKHIAGIMLENGYAYGFYTMGQLYQTGVFGKADIEKAGEYYQKGAEQGDPACLDALKKLKK